MVLGEFAFAKDQASFSALMVLDDALLLIALLRMQFFTITYFLALTVKRDKWKPIFLMNSIRRPALIVLDIYSLPDL